MSKYNKPEESTEWKPSRTDALGLSEKLKGFEKKKVNGRMQYPFELFLESEGVVSFDEYGSMRVKNPFQYKRLNKINDLREWIAEKDMDAAFQAFPEERVAYEKRIAEMWKSCRAIVDNFRLPQKT